jgi:hypothetical protein
MSWIDYVANFIYKIEFLKDYRNLIYLDIALLQFRMNCCNGNIIYIKIKSKLKFPEARYVNKGLEG